MLPEENHSDGAISLKIVFLCALCVLCGEISFFSLRSSAPSAPLRYLLIRISSRQETICRILASTLTSQIHSTRSLLKANQLSIAVCSFFFLVTVSFAQTPPAEPTLTTNPVYTKECAKCHGKTAEGRHFAGPSLINEKTAAASSEDLHNIIVSGKGHMPKFAGKLSPEDMDTLVKQIQSLNKK